MPYFLLFPLLGEINLMDHKVIEIIKFLDFSGKLNCVYVGRFSEELNK